MSQNTAKTVRVPLSKGLITEATPLTLPPEASVDELNVAIDSDGTRPKRKGMAREQAGNNFGVHFRTRETGGNFIWEFPAGDKDTSFLVIHEGAFLRFYDLRVAPLSSGRKPYYITLSRYLQGSELPASVSMAAVKGRLVVAGENLNTFSVEYKPLIDEIRSTPITFRIRDFEYIGDKLRYTQPSPNTTNVVRRYDTFNSGWTVEALDKFLVHHEEAPELTKPYYAEKHSNGYYDVEDGWDKIEGGNTLITNGHFILDLYTMDRDAASGLAGVNTVAKDRDIAEETTRFTTLVNFSGRVFYSGMRSSRSSGRVYFSQAIQDGNELGNLYQANDPTAEYLSDLLDTDGGYVDIPDAEGITHLHVFGTHLLVFATNGVWSVSGGDDVFRATDYSVNRITGIGLIHPSTFVSADGRPYWWSDTGIHTISMTEFKNLEENNLSDTTIKTKFLSIPTTVRDRATGAYDKRRKQVIWAYGDFGTPNKRLNILIMDETFGAFIPWRIGESQTASISVVNIFYNRHLTKREFLNEVLDLNGEQVISASGEPVVVSSVQMLDSSSTLIFTCINENTGRVFFAEFNDNRYMDWATAPYDAYLVTGYNFLTDLSTSKNTPQITVLCRTTEEYTDDFSEPTSQSSLTACVYWDFKYSPAYSAQQVYRASRMVPSYVTQGRPFAEKSHVQTSIRPRGRGKTVAIRLEGEYGKAFHLIGFETVDAKNATV